MKRTLYTLLGIMLCTGAWADTNLQALVDEATAGSTVTLTENVTLSERVNINKNLTVDLGGFTITTTATCGNGSAFNIVSGNVTIQNGTIDASFGESNNGETDAITARTGSDVTLKELNITVYSKNGACAYAFEGSKITIKSGHYENQTTEIYQYNPNITAMVVNQANVATQLIFIEGGTFKGFDPTLGDDSQIKAGNENATFLAEGVALKKDASGNYVTTTAVAKIVGRNYATLADAIAAATTGKTVTLIADQTLSSVVTITEEKNFTLDLNGKTLIGKLTNNGTLVVKSSVDGGKMYRSTINGNVIGNNSATASLTIESGIIELDGTPGSQGAITNKGTLLIKGGEIKSGKYPLFIAEGKCEITGGTLISTNGSIQVYLQKGGLKAPASYTNNSDATFDGAEDGYVYSLNGAMQLVTPGGTVTLLKDITGSLTLNKSMTLVLNGNNILSSGNTAIDVIGSKTSRANITITGEGNITCNNGAVCQAVQVGNYATLTINGGNYSVGGEVDNVTIYIVNSVADNPSVVNITGGTFRSGNGKWVLNTKDSAASNGATISVTGGEFYNFDPANNKNDVNPEAEGTNYVADGYITEMTESGSDKIYTVTEGQWIAKIEGGVDSKFRFTSIDNAITTANGASKDVTITLLSDATATVEPSENVTINADGNALTLPTFIVSDGKAPTYANVINATDNTYMVTTATYNRTGAVGTQWGTVCLPFSFETKPDGYTLYTPTLVNESTLTVTEVEYPIPAGTPVIFYKDNTDEVVITSSNSNIKIGSTPINGSASLSLIGTYESTNITDNLSSIYYINSDLFHQAKVNLTVPAYRAYIYIKNNAPGAKASVLNILVGDEATSINMVNMENESVAAIYDANGIRLSAPKKGMNIMKLANGKTVKLIVK